MDDFRRSTLRKMLDYPQILSELIFERLPIDLLTKLAPVVNENVEEGDGQFDDLVSPLFCRAFLQSHYQTDAILVLVGKELEAEKKRKPDRLSEIMKIVQKREDLKNNKKKLIPKATMELPSEDSTFFESMTVKFSCSYIFIENRGNDCLFKINRENENRSPIIEPTDYNPRNFDADYCQFIPDGDSSAFLDTVFLGNEDVPVFFDVEKLKLTELDDSRNFLHEKHKLCPMKFNFSRKRSWRDYKTNPKLNLHPLLNYQEEFFLEDMPMRRYTVDFSSFSGGQERIFWSFDFNLPEGRHSIWARFIGEANWLTVVLPRRPQDEAKLFHCDLNTKEVRLYSFPVCPGTVANEERLNFVRNNPAALFNNPNLGSLPLGTAPFDDKCFGIFDSCLYFIRKCERKITRSFVRGLGFITCKPLATRKSRANAQPAIEKPQNKGEYFAFGFIKKEFFGTENTNNELNNVCFFNYRGSGIISLNIGTNGLIHLVLQKEEATNAFTVTINSVKEKIPNSENATMIIGENDAVKTTLPVINLESFCIPKYRDLSESLDSDQCDVGYVEGNKLHLLV